MRGEEPPEDGYRGDYVDELGERIGAEGIESDELEAIGRRGVELMLEGVRATLDRFGVRFDNWFSERDLYASGEVEAALAQLESEGHTYRSEDALWLRTTSFGDDKDRVLIRANGEPTYLAADVAYHWDKLERGFDRLIDVLGADHHGYVARLRAAIAGLGADPARFEALIMRLVHVDRERRARADVEAQRRVRLPRRAARRHRRRRDPLVHALAQPRHRQSTSTSSWPGASPTTTRSTTSSTPTRGSPASCARPSGEPERAVAAAGVETPGTPLEPTERELVKRLLEFPERGARGRRAPRTAPDLLLLDRRRRRLPRLLPRLPGGGRRGRGGRALAPGALPC